MGNAHFSKEPPTADDVGKEWDESAKMWDKMWAVRAFNRSFLKHIDNYCNLDRSSSKCLEVGAGSGLLTLPLSTKCAQVDACDVSSEMVALIDRKLAESSVTNVKTSVGDITSNDNQFKGPYDLIVTGSVLTFCPDMVATLDAMSKRLDVGGKMLHMIFKTSKRHPKETKYFPNGIHPDQLAEIVTSIPGLKVEYTGDGVELKPLWWFPFFKMKWQLLVASKVDN
mmetsp:Transcript_16345/g.18479  ORF Transcript_16345/g.18479 Transcript_16345/m.18479 type:complete len:225 (+) Transcript_16345:133-807(+)|eukprot:CAMPEP_0204832886 /NCGR_PEP_ID=MMETSP1346-20131115/15028_1 /ASSEMBLY_ACC=CAM_ASM_000771 /TAXON_ID=215587 /ORGANISM="Aplanochytrium stocchinoi, Strain GSBS06" /LENGTH=224 /DNA_ID=CAMNT_0051964995 /DNA_START=105 /DNA_END=779 /DNA_ORIENTATION=+